VACPEGRSEIRRNAGGRTQRRPSVSLGIENAKQSQNIAFSIQKQGLLEKQSQLSCKSRQNHEKTKRTQTWVAPSSYA
jgi:hypothetical protein